MPVVIGATYVVTAVASVVYRSVTP